LRWGTSPGGLEDYDGEEHCSLDNITLHITRVSNDYIGGGGDDSEEEEEEQECSCTDEIPCAMVAEYDSLGVVHFMTCDRFTKTGESIHFSWPEMNDGWAGAN